jgi:hypothetical protein
VQYCGQSEEKNQSFIPTLPKNIRTYNLASNIFFFAGNFSTASWICLPVVTAASCFRYHSCPFKIRFKSEFAL